VKSETNRETLTALNAAGVSARNELSLVGFDVATRRAHY
jgi:hypothetical protein